MKKISAVLVAFGMLCMTACGSGTGSDGGTSTSSDGTVPYARNEYYTSFWKTDTIKNETVMLEEDENGVISGDSGNKKLRSERRIRGGGLYPGRAHDRADGGFRNAVYVV